MVAFETYGDATDDTRYVVYSATKAFVAGAMWALIGDGLVDPLLPVVAYLPEFGTNGKDVVALERVRWRARRRLPAGTDGPPALDGDSRPNGNARYGEWRLNWDPGTASAYGA